MVKCAGNTAAGLTQILTQKYVAFFQNSGLEAFYNQRRTTNLRAKRSEERRVGKEC